MEIVLGSALTRGNAIKDIHGTRGFSQVKDSRLMYEDVCKILGLRHFNGEFSIFGRLLGMGVLDGMGGDCDGIGSWKGIALG